MKGLEFILSRLLKSGKSGTLNIQDNSFLEELVKSAPPARSRWWVFPYIRGARLVGILSISALMLSLLIYYSIVFIKDNILFENRLTVNEQGAFNPHKSLNCEYGLYLFNTSDVWANTGIQISEEDRIRINISGGYNSAVQELIAAADSNFIPKYEWTSYKGGTQKDTTENEDGKEYCLSNKHGFGAPLWAIFQEGRDLAHHPYVRDTDPTTFKLTKQHHGDTLRTLHEWMPHDGKRFQKAHFNGTLYLTINDMFFEDSLSMRSFYEAHPELVRLNPNITFGKYLVNRSQHPDFDFDDNLGQVLVSVEIIRHVPHAFFYPTMQYRTLEYRVGEILGIEYEQGLLKNNYLFRFCWKLLRIIGVALLFVCSISALFLLWGLGALVFIYLSFLLFHLLHKLIESFPLFVRKLKDAIANLFRKRQKARVKETID